MKYIPDFYPIPVNERKEESVIPPEIIERDCAHYRREIINAINAAHRKYLQRYEEKGLLYSRTWGTGKN